MFTPETKFVFKGNMSCVTGAHQKNTELEFYIRIKWGKINFSIPLRITLDFTYYMYILQHVILKNISFLHGTIIHGGNTKQ